MMDRWATGGPQVKCGPHPETMQPDFQINTMIVLLCVCEALETIRSPAQQIQPLEPIFIDSFH